jgi:hypothetical protein
MLPNKYPGKILSLTMATFSVHSNVYHPSIRTDMFANVKLKDAVVDRLRDKTGKRPDTGPFSRQNRYLPFLEKTKKQKFF